jgi:hypothetical protein
VRTRRLVDCRINLPKGVVTKSFLSSHLSLYLSRSVFCSALLWAAGGNEKRLQPTAAPVAAFLQDKPAAANSQQGDFALQLSVNTQHKHCSAKTKCTHEALPPVVVLDSAHMHCEAKYLLNLAEIRVHAF